VARNAGYRTVALLANDAPGTLEICAGVRTRVQALGLQVVLDRTYPRTTTAFGDYAAAAQAAGADVLVGCAFMPDSVRALAAAGVKPKLEAFSIGPTDPAFGRQLGRLADGIVGSTTWWPSLKTKGNADFVASFERTFHRSPVYHSAMAYASLQVLAPPCAPPARSNRSGSAPRSRRCAATSSPAASSSTPPAASSATAAT
jgi:branched-chain amino acid transport system substrate-binding protein